MKIKVAISSYGNIGRAIAGVHAEAARDADHDMELTGIIRRSARVPGGDYPAGVQVADDIGKLDAKPDVVLCAAPSHIVMDDVQKYLGMGVSTIDCFDNHKEIPGWRERLDELAKKNRAVCVIGAGWDPGFDSVVRALSGLVVTENEPITTFGPGRSMGHTTTVKALHPAIKDAVSLTLPGAKPGLQKREVFIVLEKGAEKTLADSIRESVCAHSYFKNDDTVVNFVESIAAHDTDKHGGLVTREGKSAKVELKLHGVNAVMTAAAMYAAARAAGRGLAAGRYGCLTLAEIAPLDFVKGGTVQERLARIKY